MKYNVNRIDHIEKLKKIGIALSVEEDIDEFFKMVLEEAISYTNADAGSLYRISSDGKYLDFTFVCTISKNISLGRADTVKWPSVPLYDNKGNRKLKNFVSYVAHTARTVAVEDVYDQDIFDHSGTKKYDTANQYHSKSMVGVPMLNHENDVLGVIQLINALDRDNKIIPFNHRHISMVESLASQAAIALTNKALIAGLENLLYQFIKSIADAIDRKSKYTGGHISRVATLTEMIARKIHSDKYIFPEINFSDNELQELVIAGWMHDVGKITTPENIIDKATRMETIFDRIELIATRFALVKKVIENDIIKASIKKDKQTSRELTVLLKKIDADLDFLSEINNSNRNLCEMDLERIEKIASFSYRAENKIYRLITDDEKRNLLIKNGNLLPEELTKMQEHVLITHEMLSRLTFPKKFRNVALYASSHHEKLNGKGYPFHLRAEELPLQARIIAIADIFESLTASDRPYKEGKTLGQAFEVLANWASQGEIDSRILDLFLDSGLFMEYARKYLKQDQIDKIDPALIKKKYHD